MQHVRPLPPQHLPDSLRDLPVGAPLEILFNDGWWEVVYRGPAGSKHAVHSPRYDVLHTVPAALLRPGWSWTVSTRSWEVLAPEDSPPDQSAAPGKAQKAFKSKHA